LNRRNFTSLGLVGAGAALTRKLWAEQPAAAHTPNHRERYFYIAAIADTHIIDPMYNGHEDTPEDTESLFHTSVRMIAARDALNGFSDRFLPHIDHVIHLGDCFHDYPSNDYDFYFKQRTRVDGFKTILDGFHAPTHLLLGNHDYGLPGVSREFTHRLFREKYGAAPYASFDHKGWKFLQLNCFLGETWNSRSAFYDQGIGSLGEEQLQGVEAQLAEGKPTLIFIHYPLWIVAPTEIKDFGLHPLLRRHRETIKLVVSGHWHKWVDFAHTFGPQHYVMAATRYDEDAYMLLEIDRLTQSCRFVNARCVDWATHSSSPYRPEADGAWGGSASGRSARERM
jgi:3',5'-cyclic AMP phosphodiesterase CpdA